MASQTNWAGNIAFSPKRWLTPGTVSELQDDIAAHRKVRIAGSRHSFNSIVDSADTIISTENLNRVIHIDSAAGEVTVEGGARYGDVATTLDRKGFALANLASLPHISIAGAVATATHGSGVNNGNLATAVTGMQIVTADGTLATFSRESHPVEFDGMVVNIGALGAVATLTLRIEPTFQLCQQVFPHVPLPDALSNIDDVLGCAYSVSLFTTYGDLTIDQVWVKRRTDQGPPISELLGVAAASDKLHPLAGHDPVSCTTQQGIVGPWHERLPHFCMDFTPSSGDELQSEYFIPREHTAAAYRALMVLSAEIQPLLYVSEIRTVKADSLWLSPAFGRDATAFHFTWRQKSNKVLALLERIEALLLPLGAQPHWGKVYLHKPTGYAKMADFVSLRQAFDLGGKFVNPYVERALGI
jgi:xylitol oxidase